MSREKWKDILGFEGIYQVSCLGRVKSLERKVKTYQGTRTVRERIMAKNDNGNGYKYVDLSTKGIVSRNYIHRLVARAFIPNDQDKPEINHLNGDKADNRVDNLEWTTRRDNQQHAFDYGLRTGSTSDIDIIQLEMLKDLMETEKYSSTELMGVFNVSDTMFFKIKSGVVTTERTFEEVKRDKLSNGYKTIVFDKELKEEREFASMKQASEYYGHWNGYFSELNRESNGENNRYKVKVIEEK